jgi:hypothetical protein
MKRLTSIDEVKQAMMNIEQKSTQEEMKEAKKTFRNLFLQAVPESLTYMLDEYNSFVGMEKEEELSKLGKDSSHALEISTLSDHMKSLYQSAEIEAGRWFPFVDFIAALNRQIQNLDIVLIQTNSGFCIIRRVNYCIIRKAKH